MGDHDPSRPGGRPADLVDRDITATRPNQLWVSDFTYVATWRGFVYAAFVIDTYARRIVGWRAALHMRTELATDALEQAIAERLGTRRADDLRHHSDAFPLRQAIATWHLVTTSVGPPTPSAPPPRVRAHRRC